jgi:hypothetical protein
MAAQWGDTEAQTVKTALEIYRLKDMVDASVGMSIARIVQRVTRQGVPVTGFETGIVSGSKELKHLFGGNAIGDDPYIRFISGVVVNRKQTLMSRTGVDVTVMTEQDPDKQYVVVRSGTASLVEDQARYQASRSIDQIDFAVGKGAFELFRDFVTEQLPLEGFDRYMEGRRQGVIDGNLPLPDLELVFGQADVPITT